MYFGMYKISDKDLRAIKNGIRRDLVSGIYNKIAYEYTGTQTITGLKKYVVEALETYDDNAFENIQMSCNIALNKVNKAGNYFIPIAVAVISIFLTITGLLFNLAVTLTFSSIDYSFALSGASSQSIQSEINEALNSISGNASIFLGMLFLIVFIAIAIAIGLTLVRDLIISHSYIYYNFLNDCIQIAKERKKEEKQG